jgi:hypothetical protein
MLFCFLLVLLGCGASPYTPVEQVRSDVEAHLAARYGRAFVVASVSRQGGGPKLLLDAHRFEAHLVSDPTVRFEGRVNYDHDPIVFHDRFLCSQVQPLLEARLAEVTPKPLGGSQVICGNDDDLPPGMDPAAPTPADLSGLTWKVYVDRFTDEALDVAEQTVVEELRSTAAKVGLTEIDAQTSFYPAALEPSKDHLGEGRTRPGTLWRRAVVFTDPSKERLITPRMRAVERELDEHLRTSLPDGVQLQVVVQPRTRAAKRLWEKKPDLRWSELKPEEREMLPVRLQLAAFDSARAPAVEAFVDQARALTRGVSFSAELGFYEPPADPVWAHPERYQRGVVWKGDGQPESTESFLLGPAPRAVQRGGALE